MAIDPRVDIGHVHLKVSDLERSLDFWCGVMGFELQHRYATKEPSPEQVEVAEAALRACLQLETA